jgi:hypothetical protein
MLRKVRFLFSRTVFTGGMLKQNDDNYDDPQNVTHIKWKYFECCLDKTRIYIYIDVLFKVSIHVMLNDHSVKGNISTLKCAH